MNYKAIAKEFSVPGRFISARPFGNGLINDTFLTTFSHQGKQCRYVLRRINRNVFKNPEMVIDNGMLVSEHIQKKLLDSQYYDADRRIVTFYRTRDKRPYYIDTNNDYWSMISFITDAYTKDIADNEVSAYEAAKAFGSFQNMMWDACISSYNITINNFHDLKGRLKTFDTVCSQDPKGRCADAAAEVDLARRFRYIETKINAVLSDGSMPLRITHNDTKINNIMLDTESDRGICVIDLDTVMPGYIIFDFGDMVRSFTNSGGEETKEDSAVYMRQDIFRALCRGYITELQGRLSPAEKKNLLLGARAITYEQAVRFLTDYIAGDVYYTARYHKHNLFRARNQLKLLASIEHQLEDMSQILKNYI